MPVVVAHLFWDELLMFVVPVVLVLAAVRWAERRRPDDEVEDPGSPTDPGGNVNNEPSHDGGAP